MKEDIDFSNLPKTGKEAKEQGKKFYFTGKTCKHGHLDKRWTSNGTCVTCAYNLADKKRDYYNRRQRESYGKNKNTINAKRREWRKNNPEKVRAGRLRNKDRRNIQRRERYANDKNYQLNSMCRNFHRRVLERLGCDKENPTFKALGYDGEKLRLHIESLFLEGMSWDNYGDWEIDHKFPISRYIEIGVYDVSIINSLDNLVPMWSIHNTQKHNRTLEEFLEDRPELKTLYSNFIKYTET